MARTVGSKNKPKALTSKTITLNKQIEGTAIINDEVPQKYVYWGKRNNYPTMLLDLYANSITHSSCIDFLVNAIIGEGVDYKAMKLDGNEVVPNAYETWESLLRNIALDLCIFNGYAIQIIKNKNDNTYSFFHQPFSTVRFGKKDEEGEIKKVYLCQDWSNTAKYNPIEVEHLNTLDDLNLEKGKPYILTYVRKNIFDPYYPSPHYLSAIDAIQTDIKLKTYDYQSVLNGFTSSGALVLNRVEDENDRRDILRNVEQLFTGADNANSVMVLFKNSNEDSPIQWQPFTQSQEGIDVHTNNNNRTVNRIVTAHHIASKSLIGISLDGNGFASEANILEAAYNLTEKLVTSTMRKEMVNTINSLFKMNGIEQEVALIPLSFNLLDVEKEEKENTSDNEENKNEEVEKIEKPENEPTQK